MSKAFAIPTFDDLETMARTVFGEARGEPAAGQLAVAWVILNRWRSGTWFAGKTIAETCRKHSPKGIHQFSCWNEGDPTRARMESAGWNEPALRRAADATLAALSGLAPDPTKGAAHYHADTIPAPVWARGKTPSAVIGRHRFFVGIA